jgi:hypothetical protein
VFHILNIKALPLTGTGPCWPGRTEAGIYFQNNPKTGGAKICVSSVLGLTQVIEDALVANYFYYSKNTVLWKTGATTVKASIYDCWLWG